MSRILLGSRVRPPLSEAVASVPNCIIPDVRRPDPGGFRLSLLCSWALFAQRVALRVGMLLGEIRGMAGVEISDKTNVWHGYFSTHASFISNQLI